MAELRIDVSADSQWGQMRVSCVRYGLPHSLVLIKSYELSLTGMRECVSGVCYVVG